MTTALTLADLAAMTARAESAAVVRRSMAKSDFWEYLANSGRLAGMAPALARDVLSLLALYTASQAALTGALAELTAARAEIAHGRQLEYMFPESEPE